MKDDLILYPKCKTILAIGLESYPSLVEAEQVEPHGKVVSGTGVRS